MLSTLKVTYVKKQRVELRSSIRNLYRTLSYNRRFLVDAEQYLQHHTCTRVVNYTKETVEVMYLSQ